MKRIASTGLFGLFVAAVAGIAPAASAQETYSGGIVALPLGTLSLGTSIAVECANPGSQQDVLKTPILKNTTGATLKAGMVVSWSASDGDKGSVRLSADLAPNATLKVQGSKPGQVYTCSSQFFSRPDLLISRAAPGTGGIQVDLSNADPWAGASPSVVKLEVISCSGSVLQTLNASPVAMAKGEKKTLTFAATMPAKSYLRVTADAQGQVGEKLETNNVWDAINSCLR